MLFDLRGKRKRAIQATYLILAVLFGGGLVLFGVGSDVQGGLVDAISGNSGGGNGSSTFEKQAERYERAVRANPRNEQAWLALARANYNAATSGEDFDSETGQFEEGAVDDLSAATRAWERYLRLDPKRPDTSAASLMVQAYAARLQFGSGVPLDIFERAAEAQQIIAQQRPSPIAWFNLAAIRYQIGKIGAGDRAGDRALALTPRDQRNTVRAQLDEARKDGLKFKKELKKSEEQAAQAAREARKSGEDPFGTTPGQAPLGQ